MRQLLGGKGAGLAEMTNAGLPVPPGFTITTEACNAYYEAGKQLPDGLWDDVDGPHEGDWSRRPARASATPQNPLLVSVRSGAAFSMPGMMDTVLNLGLNPDTVQGLITLDRQRALRAGTRGAASSRCSGASSSTSRQRTSTSRSTSSRSTPRRSSTPT